MKNLYITGMAGSGKTAVALGMALKLKNEGYNVTYFKPIGNQSKFNGNQDNDALLMSEILKIDTDIKNIVPFSIGPSYLSVFKNRELTLEGIKEAFRIVSEGKDIVIIEGAAFPYVGAACGFDVISLAGQLNAFVLNIIKIENDLSVDKAIFLNNYLVSKGRKNMGHIFNNVPRQLLSKTEGVFKQILESTGCENYGIIPMRAEFALPTVSEYYEALGGELLFGEDKLNLIVEEILVGAMTTESALQYMRRLANKAVVIGGDRADLALAALETNTSALILTGGLYPDVKVVSRAAEKGVPVILASSDTYTTIERISKVARQIHSYDSTGINIAVENIVQYCDWQKLISSLK